MSFGFCRRRQSSADVKRFLLETHNLQLAARKTDTKKYVVVELRQKRTGEKVVVRFRCGGLKNGEDCQKPRVNTLDVERGSTRTVLRVFFFPHSTRIKQID